MLAASNCVTPPSSGDRHLDRPRDGCVALDRGFFRNSQRASSCALIRGNPLGELEQLSEHVDKREVRRALTFDEYDRLIASTPNEMRQLYYLFSGRCGLRWCKIRQVEWEGMDLTKGLIHLRPEATKSCRADVLDIPPYLLGRPRRIYSRNATKCLRLKSRRKWSL